MAPFNPTPARKEQIKEAVARSKREIIADIASGRVPATVKTFSELHDYVDANEYGGLCDESSPLSKLPPTYKNRRVDQCDYDHEKWHTSGKLCIDERCAEAQLVLLETQDGSVNA